MIKVKVNNEYKDVVKIFGGGTLQKEIIKVWSREAQEYVYESEVEYTGTLPITITADGNALLDYKIYGNTVQTGTPTPENPIMPIGCGELETTGTRTGQYKLPMVSRTENLFDISEITECSVGTISRNGIEYTDIGYYTITAFGALNGWCYVQVLNGKNIVRTEHFIVPGQLTPVKINLSVGQRLVIYDANAGSVESTKRLFEQWKPVILYSDSSQPEYPSSYIPYGSTVTNIYLGEAETTRRIKKLVLTGEENCYRYVYAGANGIEVSNVLDVNYIRANGFCSHYPVYPQSISNNNTLWIGVNSKSLFFVGILDMLGISSASDFKAFLAQQYAAGTPVTIWYVLAEPETGVVNEPLMKIANYADTISMEQADVRILTNKGTIIIDYDGTPKPSQMYIKYRR